MQQMTQQVIALEMRVAQRLQLKGTRILSYCQEPRLGQVQKTVTLSSDEEE